MTDVLIDYHRPGKPRRAYHEHLLVNRPDVKILLLDGADTSVRVQGRTVLEPGAPIVWFVFPETWCGVARFHLADRAFTGWYTNLCAPVVMTEDRWTITDLFLDLWTPADGHPEWLDEDEFAAAIASGALTGQLAHAALAERARLESLLREDAWPPSVCREVDLETLRTIH